MLIYADKLHQKNVLAERVQTATNFIVRSAVVDSKDQSVKWTEGVFFSGGGFVRRVLLWTSEAYTTALGMNALDRYRHVYLNEELVK